MTDRPTHPLTKEAYLTIVNDADTRPSTKAFFEANFYSINDATHKMAVDAACNTRYYGEIREYTEDGKKAMEHVITAVACCVSHHLELIGSAFAGETFRVPHDSHAILKALVSDRYLAWRRPSETYMCM